MIQNLLERTLATLRRLLKNLQGSVSPKEIDAAERAAREARDPTGRTPAGEESQADRDSTVN